MAGQPKQKVLAFFTAKEDHAHISFVRQANQWFARELPNYGIQYDTTSDWQQLDAENLKEYQLIIFLDTRPPEAQQQKAFEEYIKKGGAWLGFHFAGFALTPSDVPQDWNWYHNEFLGSGQYVSNTWRPTSAILRVEDTHHPATDGVPVTFRSAPNEWYRWERDLRRNKDITILLSIDPSSFPLGTGPKAHEIWHEGYYPVAWTNTKYRMVYVNMGHNDIDYEGGSLAELSNSFSSQEQNTFTRNAILWLITTKK